MGLKKNIAVAGMALTSSKSAGQIKSEMESLYIDYGITARQYYENSYHKKDLKDIEKKLDKQFRKNARVKIMSEETGLDIDVIKEKMNMAKQKYGITNRQYYIGRFYLLPESGDLGAAYKQWKENREQSHKEIYEEIDRVVNELGLDREQIEADMMDALDNLNISKKEFLRDQYYLLSRTERARAGRRKFTSKEKRAEIISCISQRTGKNADTIKDEKKKIAEMYPDHPFNFGTYFENGLYLIDTDDKEAIDERMQLIYRREALEDRADRGDFSVWDEYKELVQKVMTDEHKEQLKQTLRPSLDVDDDTLTDAALDMYLSRKLLGFGESEYVSYHLWNKTIEEKEEFLSKRDKNEVFSVINPMEGSVILDNKYKAYLEMQPFYDREVVHLKGSAEYPLFKQFALKHDSFVKKDNYDSKGRGVEKVDIKQKKKLKEVYFELAENGNDDMVLEELITANEKVKKLNPDSINTVRINTFRDLDGNVSVLFCSIRVGRSGSFVDNSGAGGVFMHINKETGVTDTNGMDETGVRYDTHPDHGYALKGIQIPDWDEAVETAKKLAATMPKLSYVGWDLTYDANNKWVVIEGNTKPGFYGPQASVEKGARKEFMSYALPVLEEMLPDSEIDPEKKEIIAEKWGIDIYNE